MIEKRIKIDKIEIVGDFRHIQTRLKVEIVEDGVVIGSLPNIRLSAKAPDSDIMAHPDVSVGKQKMAVPVAIKTELSEISKKVWTQDIKDNWQAKKAKDAENETGPVKPKPEDVREG